MLYCVKSVLELGSKFRYPGKRIPDSDLREAESMNPLSSYKI